MNDKGLNQLLRNQFIAEADEHLVQAESVLLSIEKDPKDAALFRDILRALHSLKGISGVILSLIDQKHNQGAHYLNGFHTISHLSESLLQRIRDNAAEGPGSIPLLFDGLDTLKAQLEAFRRDDDSAPDGSALIDQIKNRLNSTSGPVSLAKKSGQGRTVLNDMVQQNLELLETGLDQFALGEDKNKALNLCKRALAALKRVAEKDGFTWISSHLDRWSPGFGLEGGLDLPLLKTNIAEIRSRLSQPDGPAEAPPDLLDSPKGTGLLSAVETGERLVRLSQEKIDEFMNLIGELKIQSNFLHLVYRDLEQNPVGEADLIRLKTVSESIGRLSQDLQERIMSVRLLPLSLVFSRFPRLVRDLGRKTGKEIRLELRGEETVIDKNLIDKLQDPLMHMVRNAIDHGIETSEERLALGKPREGTIRLQASSRGQKVLIEISDDGRGLDRKKIIRHACKFGIAQEDELVKMADQQIFQLLFAPGFSLSEKVSELSGRGVGLDVVRNNILQIAGAIEIHSTYGVGTRFTIQLPLTMAVGKGLLVGDAGLNVYIPLEVIVETMPLEPSHLFSFKGKEAVLVRDQILRAYRLGSLLGLSGEDTQTFLSGEGDVQDSRRLLVLEVNGRRSALIVSSCFQESEYLVKPLQGLVEDISGFSGAMITAEGNVILVLDMAALILRQEEAV